MKIVRHRRVVIAKFALVMRFMAPVGSPNPTRAGRSVNPRARSARACRGPMSGACCKGVAAELDELRGGVKQVKAVRYCFTDVSTVEMLPQTVVK